MGAGQCCGEKETVLLLALVDEVAVRETDDESLFLTLLEELAVEVAWVEGIESLGADRAPRYRSS